MSKRSAMQGSFGLSFSGTAPANDGAVIACIHIPHFAWQVETRRRPELNGDSAQSALIASRSSVPAEELQNGSKRRSERTVLDCSPGLRDVLSGMPLGEAISRHKEALLVEADLPHYAIVFDEILDGLEQRVPDVEAERPGLAYVGIWGLEGLYGDDAQVVRVLASAAGGFDLRIGVGENKWVAYMAATASRPGSGRKVVGQPGRFLSRFPVKMLPVPYEVIQRLRSFGMKTMGDVADLPQGPMEAQFGPVGRTVWQLANGIDNRPLVPRRAIETVSEYLMFPDATVSLPVVLQAIESLLTVAFSRRQLARRYAREAYLQAQVFRKAPWTVHVAFKEPVGSKDRALFAIKTKLDTLEMPGPLEDLRLTLAGLSWEAWRQESMWKEVQREDQFREMLSQLRARLGVAPPIYQVRELEPWSRIPERRHALVQLSP